MAAVMIVLVAGTLAAAIFDVRWRRIPNLLTASMAVAALAIHATGGWRSILSAAATMAVAFLVGAVAFSRGWLGGGDVKVIAAACGLAGFPGALTLVSDILIAGAALALAQAARDGRLIHLLQSASRVALTGIAPQTRTLVPYGVAVAGGSAAFALLSFLSAARLPQ